MSSRCQRIRSLQDEFSRRSVAGSELQNAVNGGVLPDGLAARTKGGGGSRVVPPGDAAAAPWPEPPLLPSPTGSVEDAKSLSSEAAAEGEEARACRPASAQQARRRRPRTRRIR